MKILSVPKTSYWRSTSKVPLSSKPLTKTLDLNQLKTDWLLRRPDLPFVSTRQNFLRLIHRRLQVGGLDQTWTSRGCIFSENRLVENGWGLSVCCGWGQIWDASQRRSPLASRTSKQNVTPKKRKIGLLVSLHWASFGWGQIWVASQRRSPLGPRTSEQNETEKKKKKKKKKRELQHSL